MTKTLTKTEMKDAIRMLRRSREEHERLYYASLTAQERMQHSPIYRALMHRYDIAIQTLNYASNRIVGTDLKELFEFPIEDDNNGNAPLFPEKEEQL